jgi:3-deoxy-manno-octulosonate cytidylyltransferase (CMP-KDO synthetase)
MNILGIIPARFASTRFPGKPLVAIEGKPMIQHVYEQSLKAALQKVVIATDDERIFNAAKGFGAEVLMTSNNHKNGTERCAEVLQQLGNEFDACINIQGDEPFINPEQINLIATLLQQKASIATLVKNISDAEALNNSNIVKAVISKQQQALYFSRYAIPFIRSGNVEDALKYGKFYKHIGIYGFQKNILQEIVKLPVSFLEQTESLEQLRWLENGYTIKVAETTFETIAIDTPEDLQKLNNS